MSEVEEKIYSHIDRIRKYKLISNDRIEELKSEYIDSSIVYPWETEVDEVINVFIDPSKISGTHHPRYSKMNLFDAINRLKRGKGVILNYVKYPDYYVSDESRDHDEDKLCIAYKKHEDKYYISEGGNHRFLLSKTLGLEKVLVNRLIIYDEDVEFKRILGAIENIGFKYTIKDKFVELDSDCVRISIPEPIKENLNTFKNYYDQIRSDKITELIYKFKGSLGNHRRKFEYGRDPIKHIIHYHFLNLQEHKRENITK